MKEELLKQIIKYFSLFRYKVELNNAIHFFDINDIAEDLVQNSLNFIYDLNLINLNSDKINYPGIDLGDKKKKIAFQVTSIAKSSKIQKSIDNFINADFDPKLFIVYESIYIFIITKKQSSYRTIFNTKKLFLFDNTKHIIDFEDLIKKIKGFSTSRLKSLVDILDLELKDYYHGDFKDETIKLMTEIDRIHHRVLNFEDISSENNWEKISLFKYLKAANFNTIKKDYSVIKEYFAIIDQYKLNPKRNGTGHLIEQWLKNMGFEQKYLEARQIIKTL